MVCRKVLRSVYRPPTLKCSFLGCGRWFRNHSGRTKHINTFHRPPSPISTDTDTDSTSTLSDHDDIPFNALDADDDLRDVFDDFGDFNDADNQLEQIQDDLRGDEEMNVDSDSDSERGHGPQAIQDVQPPDCILGMDASRDNTQLRNQRIYHDVLTGDFSHIL